MILNKNKICVVAAHPDDEVFGLGGTLLKAADNGCEINIIFLTNGEDARDSVDKNAIIHRKNCAIKAKEFIGANDYKFLDFPDNKLDSVPLLSVIKKLEEFFVKTSPEIIFTHFSNDLNIDHQIAFQSTITASRPTSNNPTKYYLTL